MFILPLEHIISILHSIVNYFPGLFSRVRFFVENPHYAHHSSNFLTEVPLGIDSLMHRFDIFAIHAALTGGSDRTASKRLSTKIYPHSTVSKPSQSHINLVYGFYQSTRSKQRKHLNLRDKKSKVAIFLSLNYM